MNYLHSGCLGDVIFSIPSIKSLQGQQNKTAFCKATLYLRPGVPDPIPGWAGDRPLERMSRAGAESLIQLLTGQPGFNEIAIYTDQHIDYDLDKFRINPPIDLARYDIHRYYSLVYKCRPSLAGRWLKIPPSRKYAKAIFVNRTTRYRNPKISYRFLAGKPNVYFVG